MNILVTGSTGFIGSHICRALIKRGHHVRAFHRATSVLSMLEDLPVEHVIGDLTQPETLRAAAHGMDILFHTAAMMGTRHPRSGRMYTVIVEGTRSLFQAARAAGIQRIVHTSSVAALGVPPTSGSRLPQSSLLDENHTWSYRSDYWPYGYAKYLAEMEVQRIVAQGMDVVIVNPSIVMGDGDIYRQDRSLVMQIALQKLPLLIESGLNVVHIADVVEGHLAALEHGRTGERYILGGKNLSLADLAEMIASIAGVTPPQVILSAGLARQLTLPVSLLQSFLNLPVDASLLRLAGVNFHYSIRKAQVGLSLSPPRPVEEAIQDAYDWFQDIGALPKSAG
jgi:dihydroflavonol-4-reductase